MDHPLSYLHPHPGWGNYEFPQPMPSFPAGIVGKHCILELYDCNQNKLNDEAFIRTTLTMSAKQAGAQLINMITHSFSPQGVTGLALLAESHISIHTWPEIGYAAVDVFTCGKHTFPEIACESMVKEFSPRTFSVKNIERQTPCQLSDSFRTPRLLNKHDME